MRRDSTPLARALRARGITLTGLSRASGCSRSSAQNMLHGGGVTLYTARRIVRAFPWLDYDSLADLLYGVDLEEGGANK